MRRWTRMKRPSAAKVTSTKDSRTCRLCSNSMRNGWWSFHLTQRRDRHPTVGFRIFSVFTTVLQIVRGFYGIEEVACVWMAGFHLFHVKWTQSKRSYLKLFARGFATVKKSCHLVQSSLELLSKFKENVCMDWWVTLFIWLLSYEISWIKEVFKVILGKRLWNMEQRAMSFRYPPDTVVGGFHHVTQFLLSPPLRRAPPGFSEWLRRFSRIASLRRPDCVHTE